MRLVDTVTVDTLYCTYMVLIYFKYSAVTSNSCLEPMDCLPLANSAGSEDEKIEDCCDGDLTKSSDINMESCTNPPTPASVMQVQLCHDIRLKQLL